MATGKSRKSCAIQIHYVLVFSLIKWDNICVVLSVQNHMEFLGLCLNSQISVLIPVVHFTSTALRINIPVS